MEVFVLVIVIPELLIILISLIMVVASLAGYGDFARIIPCWRPSNEHVPPSYWGAYRDMEREKVTSIVLHRLLSRHEPESFEPESFEPEWNDAS